MNLNESTLKIDVNSLKSYLADNGIDYSINQIKDDLKSLNAVVRAERDEDGGLYMIVGGDIDMDRLESVFDECMVNVNDFIVDDIPDIENYGEDFDDIDSDLYECDKTPLAESAEYPAYESIEMDYPSFDEVDINEKKKDCCPKKKLNEHKSTSIDSLSKKNYSKKMNEQKEGTLISSLGKDYYHKNDTNQHLIPLKEALSGKEIKFDKTPNVNDIIDSLTGKKNSRRINEAAIKKARMESGKHINENYEYLSKKLGKDLASRIWKALSEKKTSLYEKVKINGEFISKLTLEELQKVFSKVCKKVDELERSSKKEGLNETDATNTEKKLQKSIRLKTILTEEIEFRSALKEAEDNGADSFLDQFNLDPNAESDNNENKDKDDADDNKDKDTDDNSNPDEDEVEEIGSIVITMASEQAANDLKKELEDEGIPSDCIEIEPVEDEDEDENNEENSDEDNSSEEENKSNESKSVKVNGRKLNEDDENNSDDNADKNDNQNDENGDNEESSDDDDSDKQYKVILTNTDYAEQLQNVMLNIYGIEQKEFEDMIGGTIVGDDDDSDDNESSDEDNQEKDDNSGEENNDSSEEEEEIDPETVFKGL